MAINTCSTIEIYVIKNVVNSNGSSVLICGFFIYLVLSFVLSFLQKWRYAITNTLILNINKDTRSIIVQQIFKTDYLSFSTIPTAEVYTTITDDIDNMGSLFSDILLGSLNNFLYLMFLITLMLTISTKFTLITFFVIVLLQVLIFIIIKNNQKMDTILRTICSHYNFEMLEIYNNFKNIHLFNLQDKYFKKINNILKKETNIAQVDSFIYSWLKPISIFIEISGLYIIINLALKSNLESGSIVSILYYAKVCFQISQTLIINFDEISLPLNAFQRVNKFVKYLGTLEQTKDVFGITFPQNFNGYIKFENVSFKYKEKIILENISFDIKKGEKLFIIGESGAGKTTIANILTGLYRNYTGNIFIDDVSLSDISISSLRNNIMYLPQNPFLIDASLKNNILLNNKNITNKTITEYINIIKETCPYFQFDLDRKIDPIKISKGEAQIISIIRAAVSQRKIYIFDEPTSNLDFNMEKTVRKIIDHIFSNSTLIIITHRISLIKETDKIFSLTSFSN